jgi:hypothetical protein
MNINKYLELRDENKIINRALSRTNLCVEALKSRIDNLKVDKTTLADNYGKEFILILQNYLIQKYYEKYNLITEESYQDERLFFYSYTQSYEKYEHVGILDMLKGKHYLSEYIINNGDIFSAILTYGHNGFQEVENQIINNCTEKNMFEKNDDSKITLTLYQLVTIGNCLGYFDFILISDEIPDSEEFMMTEFKKGKFLIRSNNKKFYINKFNGQLILSFDKLIGFDEWCNYNVGNGLKYLVNLK